MLSIQATRGQIIGAVLAIAFAAALIFGAVSYVNDAYASAATHTNTTSLLAQK